MNKQCSCSMSVLQKPCPREPFQCLRCLVAQKNTDRVWQVDCPEYNIRALEGSNYVSKMKIPAFTRSLYWDRGNPGALSSSMRPPGTTSPLYDGIECVCGIAGDTGFGSPVNSTASDYTWGRGPYQVVITKDLLTDTWVTYTPPSNVAVSLYWYDARWHLTLGSVFKILTDGIVTGSPQILLGVLVANYESNESGCFIDNGATFRRFEWHVKLASSQPGFYDQAGADLSPHILDSGDSPAPQEITFRHIKIFNSDLDLSQI